MSADSACVECGFPCVNDDGGWRHKRSYMQHGDWLDNDHEAVPHPDDAEPDAPHPPREAGGAGAGHSLPGAGSDLVGSEIGSSLLEGVDRSEESAFAAGVSGPVDETSSPVAGGLDNSVPSPLGHLAEVVQPGVHDASPAAPGSAHHKRDTRDGEATVNESQGRADATPAADPLATARHAAIDAVHDTDTKYRRMTGFDAPNSRVVDAVLDALEAAGLRVVPATETDHVCTCLDGDVSP